MTFLGENFYVYVIKSKADFDMHYEPVKYCFVQAKYLIPKTLDF